MKFSILGVGMHPELHMKILRHMVKELAQLDLPFLNYTQKTANLKKKLEMANIDSLFALTRKRLA